MADAVPRAAMAGWHCLRKGLSITCSQGTAEATGVRQWSAQTVLVAGLFIFAIGFLWVVLLSFLNSGRRRGMPSKAGLPVAGNSSNQPAITISQGALQQTGVWLGAAACLGFLALLLLQVNQVQLPVVPPELSAIQQQALLPPPGAQGEAVPVPVPAPPPPPEAAAQTQAQAEAVPVSVPAPPPPQPAAEPPPQPAAEPPPQQPAAPVPPAATPPSLEHITLSEIQPLALKAADALKRSYTGPMDLDEQSRKRADELAAAWYSIPAENRTRSNKPGYYLSLQPDPPYPFQRILRQDDSDTGIIGIIAPFYDTNFWRAEAARGTFWRLKQRGHIIIGISSYQEFPGPIVNPHDDRHTTPADVEQILSHVDGWLHCTRTPETIIPPGVPRILLSESDFHNPDRNDSGGRLVPQGLAKEYDIVYSNQGQVASDWHDYCRNWTLAKAAFIQISKEIPTIKIGVLGRNITLERDNDLKPYVDSGQVFELPWNLPWRDFLMAIERARILMVPNTHDASPRVAVEALSLNVPILMNKNINGGWKYVTPDTGEYFTGPEDVVAPVRSLLSAERIATLRPRAWFKEHWGLERSTFILQGFLELTVGPERIAFNRRLAMEKNPN